MEQGMQADAQQVPSNRFPEAEFKPSDVSESRPGLERADGKGMKPTTNPNAFKINLDVKSVAYLKTSQMKEYCAVLIQVTFVLPGTSVLAAAHVPFHVKLTSKEDSGSRDKPHRAYVDVDVPYVFPEGEEVFVLNSYSFVDTTSNLPQVSFSAATVAAASIGGMGTTHERRGTGNVRIKRCGMRQSRVASVGLRWTFTNSNSDFYPASHKLIVLVSNDSNGSPVKPFTFKLTLESSLTVKSNQRRGILDLIPRSPPTGGWEFRIAGNYNPKVVDGLLREVDNTGRCDSISLAKMCPAPSV